MKKFLLIGAMAAVVAIPWIGTANYVHGFS
jgi:hypothetical protein